MSITEFWRQARILKTLLWRDLHVIKIRIRQTIIDGAFTAVVYSILYGGILPGLGIPGNAVGLLYLNTILMIMYQIGHALSTKIVFDLAGERFIDYQCILPTTKWVVMLSYIISFIIEGLCNTIPLLLLGITLLGKQMHISHVSIFGLIAVYLLTLIFLGTFFITIGIKSNRTWFLDNVFSRRLTPLFTISTVYIPWHAVNQWSPTIARLLLCNPLTYAIEGLRAALIGGQPHLPLWWCISALSMTCIITIAWFSRIVRTHIQTV